MSDESNVPDWLKQLRPQELGGAYGQPSAPPPQPAGWQAPPPPEPEPEPAPLPSDTDGLDALREIASVELPPPPEPRRATIPIIGPVVNQLTPLQRFVLALLLFLNISVLGCAFLMVMNKVHIPFTP